MDPSTCEDVLILFYNNDLWDVHLANEIEEEEAKQRAEERQQALQPNPLPRQCLLSMVRMRRMSTNFMH